MAVPGYELRLLDEAGQPVPVGTPGTLYVRGDSTATGYWSRYDASRQVFQGEWLRTGDTYLRDPDGYCVFLGRTSDMLKVSGMWVSPAEVEARLLAHPAVAQAVVVSANDTDGLEKPVAYVIPEADQTVAEDELIEFCRAGLPSFERPRKVLFVGGYPTTATGKIRRVELREMAAEWFNEQLERKRGGARAHWAERTPQADGRVGRQAARWTARRLPGAAESLRALTRARTLALRARGGRPGGMVGEILRGTCPGGLPLVRAVRDGRRFSELRSVVGPVEAVTPVDVTGAYGESLLGAARALGGELEEADARAEALPVNSRRRWRPSGGCPNGGPSTPPARCSHSTTCGRSSIPSPSCSGRAPTAPTCSLSSAPPSCYPSLPETLGERMAGSPRRPCGGPRCPWPAITCCPRPRPAPPPGA